MDTLTKTERSRVMGLVKSKNTKPELIVRWKNLTTSPKWIPRERHPAERQEFDACFKHYVNSPWFPQGYASADSETNSLTFRLI